MSISFEITKTEKGEFHFKVLADDGRTLARFFFATDPDGYKIEVIQRGGRFG